MEEKHCSFVNKPTERQIENERRNDDELFESTFSNFISTNNNIGKTQEISSTPLENLNNNDINVNVNYQHSFIEHYKSNLNIMTPLHHESILDHVSTSFHQEMKMRPKNLMRNNIETSKITNTSYSIDNLLSNVEDNPIIKKQHEINQISSLNVDPMMIKQYEMSANSPMMIKQNELSETPQMMVNPQIMYHPQRIMTNMNENAEQMRIAQSIDNLPYSIPKMPKFNPLKNEVLQYHMTQPQSQNIPMPIFTEEAIHGTQSLKVASSFQQAQLHASYRMQEETSSFQQAQLHASHRMQEASSFQHAQLHASRRNKEKATTFQQSQLHASQLNQEEATTFQQSRLHASQLDQEEATTFQQSQLHESHRNQTGGYEIDPNHDYHDSRESFEEKPSVGKRVKPENISMVPIEDQFKPMDLGFKRVIARSKYGAETKVLKKFVIYIVPESDELELRSKRDISRFLKSQGKYNLTPEHFNFDNTIHFNLENRTIGKVPRLKKCMKNQEMIIAKDSSYLLNSSNFNNSSFVSEPTPIPVEVLDKSSLKTESYQIVDNVNESLISTEHNAEITNQMNTTNDNVAEGTPIINVKKRGRPKGVTSKNKEKKVKNGDSCDQDGTLKKPKNSRMKKDKMTEKAKYQKIPKITYDDQLIEQPRPLTQYTYLTLKTLDGNEDVVIKSDKTTLANLMTVFEFLNQFAPCIQMKTRLNSIRSFEYIVWAVFGNEKELNSNVIQNYSLLDHINNPVMILCDCMLECYFSQKLPLPHFLCDLKLEFDLPYKYNSLNMSSIIRLLIEQHINSIPNNSLTSTFINNLDLKSSMEKLKVMSILSLTPREKSALLDFLINLLLKTPLILANIEKITENFTVTRSAKWNLESLLRRLRRHMVVMKPTFSNQIPSSREKLENNDQEKSLENNDLEKSLENNDQEKSLENIDQEKSLENIDQEKSLDNNDQEKSLDNNDQEKCLENIDQEKCLENIDQEKCLENNDQEKNIENTSMNDQEKNIENASMNVQEKNIENASTNDEEKVFKNHEYSPNENLEHSSQSKIASPGQPENIENISHDQISMENRESLQNGSVENDTIKSEELNEPPPEINENQRESIDLDHNEDEINKKEPVDHEDEIDDDEFGADEDEEEEDDEERQTNKKLKNKNADERYNEEKSSVVVMDDPILLEAINYDTHLVELPESLKECEKLCTELEARQKVLKDWSFAYFRRLKGLPIGQDRFSRYYSIPYYSSCIFVEPNSHEMEFDNFINSHIKRDCENAARNASQLATSSSLDYDQDLEQQTQNLDKTEDEIQSFCVPQDFNQTIKTENSIQSVNITQKSIDNDMNMECENPENSIQPVNTTQKSIDNDVNMECENPENYQMIQNEYNEPINAENQPLMMIDNFGNFVDFIKCLNIAGMRERSLLKQLTRNLKHMSNETLAPSEFNRCLKLIGDLKPYQILHPHKDGIYHNSFEDIIRLQYTQFVDFVKSGLSLSKRDEQELTIDKFSSNISEFIPQTKKCLNHLINLLDINGAIVIVKKAKTNSKESRARYVLNLHSFLDSIQCCSDLELVISSLQLNTSFENLPNANSPTISPFSKCCYKCHINANYEWLLPCMYCYVTFHSYCQKSNQDDFGAEKKQVNVDEWCCDNCKSLECSESSKINFSICSHCDTSVKMAPYSNLELEEQQNETNEKDKSNCRSESVRCSLCLYYYHLECVDDADLPVTSDDYFLCHRCCEACRLSKAMIESGRKRLSKKFKIDIIEKLSPCHKIMYELFKHPYADFFTKPVDLELNPLYAQIIKKPIDLLEIRKLLLNIDFREIEDFAVDIRLIFENCKRFNQCDSDVYISGRKMSYFFENRWNHIVSQLETDQAVDESQ